MPAAISGVVASIKWASYTAAAVNSYTVTRDPVTRAWSATGILVIADAFKLSQRPLTFVAPFKGGEWHWPIVDPLPRVAGPFRVRLGNITVKGRSDVQSLSSA